MKRRGHEKVVSLPGSSRLWSLLSRFPRFLSSLNLLIKTAKLRRLRFPPLSRVWSTLSEKKFGGGGRAPFPNSGWHRAYGCARVPRSSNVSLLPGYSRGFGAHSCKSSKKKNPSGTPDMNGVAFQLDIL